MCVLTILTYLSGLMTMNKLPPRKPEFIGDHMVLPPKIDSRGIKIPRSRDFSLLKKITLEKRARAEKQAAKKLAVDLAKGG